MSYAFISNLVSFEGKLPYKVTPKYTLRRATAAEVKEIRKLLNSTLPPAGRVIPPYEWDIPNKRQRSETDWLYWILAYTGDNVGDYVLERALALLEHSINIPLTFARHGKVRAPTWHPQKTLQFYADAPRYSETSPVIVKTSTLSNIRKYLEWIERADANEESAVLALNEYVDLQTLPSASKLQVLGCFSAIESLITHNPEIGEKKKDASGATVRESPSRHPLTHQLKTKLPLLERFFERPLDYTKFGAPKSEVWRQLYGFRSAIAHGAMIDFNSDFPALKTPLDALTFLRQVTKLVILVALERPDFIEDLKAV